MATLAGTIGIRLAVALTDRAPVSVHGGDARSILPTHVAEGVEAAALAIWDAAAGRSSAELVDDAASIADDASSSPKLRVAALLAVALLARRGIEVPAVALQALGDDLLIDAVLALGASAAITGVVAAAGEALSDEERRYLAHRLAAADVGGVHVAQLQLALGDIPAAVAAAGNALVSVVRGEDADDRASHAVVCVIARWVSELGGELANSIAAALPVELCVGIAAAARAVGAGDRHPLVTSLESRAYTR